MMNKALSISFRVIQSIIYLLFFFSSFLLFNQKHNQLLALYVLKNSNYNDLLVERTQVAKLKSSLRTLYVHHHDFVNMHGISLTKITMDISLYYHSNDVLKVTVSTILSEFLNRNCSPKLEQMWVQIHLKQSKTRNILGKTCSQVICVWVTLIQVSQDNSASVCWTAHARNRLLMKMSSVGKSNRGRKPTLTENG